MIKKLKLIFVIVVIAFIFLISGIFIGKYFFSDKNIIVNDNKNNESVNNSDNNENLDNNDWMSYIINSDINSIKLSYCTTEGELDSSDYKVINHSIDITKNDLNRIFTEMKKGTVTKNYYGGLGGDCSENILINYKTDEIVYINELPVNNYIYTLNIISNRFISFTSQLNDERVLSYLENTNYTVKKWNEDIDLNIEPYMFEYTYDETIIDTIISENAN